MDYTITTTSADTNTVMTDAPDNKDASDKAGKTPAGKSAFDEILNPIQTFLLLLLIRSQYQLFINMFCMSRLLLCPSESSIKFKNN